MSVEHRRHGPGERISEAHRFEAQNLSLVLIIATVLQGSETTTFRRNGKPNETTDDHGFRV